ARGLVRLGAGQWGFFSRRGEVDEGPGVGRGAALRAARLAGVVARLPEVPVGAAVQLQHISPRFAVILREGRPALCAGLSRPPRQHASAMTRPACGATARSWSGTGGQA